MDKLFNWFRDNGGYIHEDLYIDTKNNNRGIYTKNNIPKNTQLVKCPPKLIIKKKNMVF